ncbi:cobalamin-binding protein [Alkalihalobacillus sp. BA299]|uniref:cobalamin-binding protein n=1 Tax=Alkalihalobacillus sp. BA299 TaxID=2815938 RepID=UPI001ADA6359|nr:cobalamin-binding protein [Alkalihalobacillus sp. BA299]
MKIISICPSNTELLGYLGLEEQLIAIDDYSDWPKSIQTLPRLGPDLNIDMDKLASLKPDLVLASLSVPGMEKNIERLKERNLPHIVLNPNSLEEICEDLLKIGEITENQETAKNIVERIHSLIHEYETISKGIIDKPRLYWEWWPKPVFTPGGTNWLTEISRLAGGTNVFEDMDRASVQTDWEDVMQRKPDHICLVWVGVDHDKVNPEIVKKRPGWDRFAPVIDNKIHVLDEPLFCRPSPRLFVGLQKVAALLHPEKYPPFNGKDPLLDV